MLGWDDPYNSYDYWNLIFDVPQIADMKRNERDLKPNDTYVKNNDIGEYQETQDSGKAFSIIKDWGI